MEYVKLYESFWNDYMNKSNNLEDQYGDKSKKFLISVLDKLLKERNIQQKDVVNNNGSYISPHRILIYTNKPHDYSKICFSKQNEFGDPEWIVEDDHSENRRTSNSLIDITTYKTCSYINVLLENFSQFINKKTFKKINQ